jgi:type III restriction enzyme
MEVKGYDPLEEVKTAAATRWVSAVNAEGRYGEWEYKVVKKVSDVKEYLETRRNGG